MAKWKRIILTITAVLQGGISVHPAPQEPAVRSVDENLLREYTGVCQFQDKGFLYLQIWSELSGKDELVAFDESGEVRTLYPTNDNGFFAGPGAAAPVPIESRIAFQRDGGGKITSLLWTRLWTREGAAPRKARRIEIESREDVRFTGELLHLAAVSSMNHNFCGDRVSLFEISENNAGCAAHR